VVVAELLAEPSLELKPNTYKPGALNMAVVFVAAGLANVTVPGPLALLQVTVNVPLGNPSSVATPFNVTWLLGHKMVWAGPALTTGGGCCDWLKVIVT
jgi:hypothetical protein